MENGNKINPFGIEESSDGITYVDPATIGARADQGDGSDSASASAGNVSRKRGRPKGSKNAQQNSKPQTVRVDRDAISAILFSAHAMLAGATKTPEIAIDAKESAIIADAVAKVGELYDIVADPKIIAWSNLAMTVGMVYGTRFVAISLRHKTERTKRMQSNVSPIRGDVNMSGISPDGKMPPFESPTKQ